MRDSHMSPAFCTDKSERSQKPGASRVRWFLRAWGLWDGEATQSDICSEPQSQATVPPSISQTTGVRASRVTSEQMNSQRPGCRLWAGRTLGKVLSALGCPRPGAGAGKGGGEAPPAPQMPCREPREAPTRSSLQGVKR